MAFSVASTVSYNYIFCNIGPCDQLIKTNELCNEGLKHNGKKKSIEL
jgi:hypothetical protein